jgi:hypothetical protein
VVGGGGGGGGQGSMPVINNLGADQGPVRTG